jgi:SAM-dependent methyltransferase
MPLVINEENMRNLHNCYLKKGPFVEFFDQHFSDLSRTVFRGDIEFYRALAAETEGDVLELGSGTGRVAIPISLDNVKVTGLEISNFMLERAIANAAKVGSQARFQLGDMVDFELKQKFGFIYIAFGAFHHLETVEDQLNCLRCVNTHLSKSGLFVIHIRNPAAHLLVDKDYKPDERRQWVGVDEATGQRVVTENISQKVDPHMQWISETFRHTRYGENGQVISFELDEFKLRWIYRFEMEHLLVRCGFEPLECFSDFRGSKVKDEVQQIWVIKPR